MRRPLPPTSTVNHPETHIAGSLLIRVERCAPVEQPLMLSFERRYDQLSIGPLGRKSDLVSYLNTVEQTHFRRAKHHGHCGHAERLKRTVCNRDFASHFVDLLYRAFSYFAVRNICWELTAVMCRMLSAVMSRMLSLR